MSTWLIEPIGREYCFSPYNMEVLPWDETMGTVDVILGNPSFSILNPEKGSWIAPSSQADKPFEVGFVAIQLMVPACITLSVDQFWESIWPMLHNCPSPWHRLWHYACLTVVTDVSHSLSNSRGRGQSYKYPEKMGGSILFAGMLNVCWMTACIMKEPLTLTTWRSH